MISEKKYGKKVGSHKFLLPKKEEKSKVAFIVTGSLVGLNLTMYN